MSNNNITIKINFSDPLLAKVINMFTTSQRQLPIGIAIPSPAKTDAEKPSVQIGFKR